MATSSEIKARAKALAEKTDVNSIMPKEVGGIMYDLASHSENVLRNGGTLGIRKVYKSVSAMEADGINPVDLWGNPIKKGNLVVIYDGTTTGVDNNKVYAFMNPGWELSTELDAGYATRREMTDLKDETDTKLSELGSKAVVFENGTIVDGVNSDSTTKVRTSHFVEGYFRVSVKTGYVINYVYKYDVNGNYIGYEKIASSYYETDESIENVLYKFTIRKENEDHITVDDEFLNFFEYKNVYCRKELKDSIVFEQGGMMNGKNADAIDRLRTSGIITHPFFIRVKEGYKIYYLQVYDASGNFIEARQVDLNFLCVSKTDGKGYRFTITKVDISLPISLEDDFVESVGFYENSGLLEIGKLVDGVNDINTATTSKVRTSELLNAPFYAKVSDGYYIDYLYVYDKQGKFLRYVNRGQLSGGNFDALDSIDVSDTSCLYRFTVRRKDEGQIETTSGILEKYLPNTVVSSVFDGWGFFSEAYNAFVQSTKTKCTTINIQGVNELDLSVTARILHTSELAIVAAVYDKDKKYVRTLMQWGEFHGYSLKYTRESANEDFIIISSNTELSDNPFNDYNVLYSTSKKDLVTCEYLKNFMQKSLGSEFINVKEYGAKGDSVTDDTTALEEAFAESYKTKKALFFPSGTYMISRSLTLRNDMEIYGKNATIKKFPSVTTRISLPMIVGQEYAVVESTEGFVVGRQMFISWKPTKEEDGARHCTVGVITSVDSENNRIYFKSSYSGIKEGAIVAHQAGCYLSTSFAILRSWGMKYECQRCYIHNITLDGNAQKDEDSDWMNGVIHIDADSGTIEGIPYIYKAQDNSFVNITIKNSSFDGISDQGSGGALVHNCIIDNCVMHGVHFGTGYNNAKVTGNTITNCGKAGVFWCQDVGNIIVEQNYIKNCSKGCSDFEYGTAAKESLVIGNIFDSIKDIVIDFSYTAPSTGNNYGNLIIANNMVHNLSGTFVKAVNRNKVNISNNVISTKAVEVETGIIDVSQSNAVIIGNITPAFSKYVKGDAKEYANSWN